MVTVALLSLLGAAGAGPPASQKPRDVPVNEATVRQSVELALPVLWKGAKGHSERRNCFTCHNHGVPMVAFATARGRAFDVPEADLKELIEFTAASLERNKERMLKGMGPGPLPEGGETDNTGYTLFALEMAGKEPDEGTHAAVEYTLQRDRHLGYWWTPSPRPPSEHSSFMTTALAVRGVLRYGRPEQKGRVNKRVEAARAWLVKTPAKDTEDRTFRLIGLKAAGAAAEEVRKAARELADTQRGDGGWGQTDKMNSDAYATGSALAALHLTGEMAGDHPVYKRGLAFLLGTQHADGSWRVKTRSRPFQKYFESGFPHGKDQFISIAATGWAATALTLATPAKMAP